MMTPEDYAIFMIARKDSPPPGVSEVAITIEVHGETEEDLLLRLAFAIAERDIPPNKCVGLVGWVTSPINVGEVRWEYSSKLMPEMAVIWHPNAVIPPATLLDPSGVIYGRVGHSKTARYR
jgi:hypothetical protein